MNDVEIIRDSKKIPETVNAFANSSGGRIICDDGSFDVEPLAWNKKPALLNGRVYRRIEGQNVISGLWAKSIMARDAHEFSRDDFPVENVELNERAVREFFLLTGSFDLRRVGVYSGKFLTFAGALMFADLLNIRAVLDSPTEHAEIEASNIWFAYTEILPRLTSALSPKCAEAFTEMFVNALVHSDYNVDTHVNISIVPGPARVIIDNPGTIRGVVRNHRLKKIFSLFYKKPRTLGVPNFNLEQDMLNFRTFSTLNLEGRSELPNPIIL